MATDNSPNTVPIKAPRCGYKGTQTQAPCKRSAGEGTDHAGEGYCYQHDANTPSYGKYLPLVKLLDPEMRPLVLQIMESDEHIFDLRFEIASLKAKYAKDWNDLSVSAMMQTVRTIIAGTKALHEMEQGKHYYVHVNVLALVLESVGQVARQYLPDDRRDQFSRDLESAMGRMLPKTTQRSIATTALASPIIEGVEKDAEISVD